MRQGFNLNSLPFLFTSLLFISVALFAFLKNKKSRVNRSFFLFGLAASLWQFPYFIAYNLTNDVYILLWIKIAYIGWSFLTTTCYNFIASFLNLNKKNFIRIFYLISFVFLYFLFRTDYLVAGIRKFSWGNCVSVGNYYSVFLIIWLTPSLLALEYLYYEYKQAESPYNKKRIKYFLFTLPIAFLALIDLLPNYGVNIYPLGFIPLMLFGIAITYAIIRYRLLDIEIIIKKVSLIALGFAVLTSILYAASFYLQPYFSALIGKNWIILPILLSLLAGIIMLRFINFVRQIEEDELSKKFAYRPLLKKEAERISVAKNINELVAYLVRDLSSWVRLDYVGIFIFDAQTKRFFLARSIVRTKGREKLAPDLSITLHNPLVEQLIKVKKPIIRSEIEYYLNTQSASNGATGFLARVVKAMETLGTEISIPSFCEGELLAIINIGHKLNANEIITAEDLEIFTSLSNNIARAVYGFMLNKEKIRLIVASQNTIISAMEAKDTYTRGHSERVANYTFLIGRELQKQLRNFSYDLNNLKWSAQLHDVGKISIPDSILFKPGPLTEEEMAKMREHPVNGMKIISPVKEWLGEDICAGVLGHHENFDGTGYPFKQKGEEIHIFARIIRVADSFDAMTTKRLYRPTFTRKEALAELNDYKDTAFDPVIVEILEKLYNANELE